MIKDLEVSQAELINKSSQIECLNKALQETNKALSALMQTIDREKSKTESEIIRKLRSAVIPFFEKLRRLDTTGKYRRELDLLLSQIMDLTSGVAANALIRSNLSTTEFQIALLIKQGLNTNEIAQHMCISPNTVKTHRKNIRKKLNMKDANLSLRNFLLLGQEDSEVGVFDLYNHHLRTILGEHENQ